MSGRDKRYEKKKKQERSQSKIVGRCYLGTKGRLPAEGPFV